MEIERKFLIDWNEVTALGLPEVKSAQSWQGYLSAATPVVRIPQAGFCRRPHRLHPLHQGEGETGPRGDREGADPAGV